MGLWREWLGPVIPTPGGFVMRSKRFTVIILILVSGTLLSRSTAAGGDDLKSKIYRFRSGLIDREKHPYRKGMDFDMEALKRTVLLFGVENRSKLRVAFESGIDSLPRIDIPAKSDYDQICVVDAPLESDTARTFELLGIINPDFKFIVRNFTAVMLPPVLHNRGMSIEDSRGWIVFFNIAEPKWSICEKKSGTILLCADYGDDILLIRMGTGRIQWIPVVVAWWQKKGTK
jgi:hypothetical protein